jgi:uncharacterized membrane protein (DUF485 family)
VSTTDDAPSGPGSGDPTGGPMSATSSDPYAEMQASPEFAALRKRWRGFIFPMSALFLIWFLVYVLLSAYDHDLVNTTLGDTNITVGLLLGLLQFVSTFVIATVYVKFADRSLDPEAERLRAEVEGKL